VIYKVRLGATTTIQKKWILQHSWRGLPGGFWRPQVETFAEEGCNTGTCALALAVQHVVPGMMDGIFRVTRHATIQFQVWEVNSPRHEIFSMEDIAVPPMFADKLRKYRHPLYTSTSFMAKWRP
jgi:hypothetical protein